MQQPKLRQSNLEYSDVSFEEWKRYMQSEWEQGEHLALIGKTGSGKTTLSRDLCDIRSHAVVLAMKREDSTVQTFKAHGYKIIKSWPPNRELDHVVYWLRPSSLFDQREVQRKTAEFMESVFKAGGWCVNFDDTATLVDLKLVRPLGRLLNQGRSSGLSIITVMTQATSLVANLPKETVKQVSHVVVFKTTNLDEIENNAKIAGISKQDMLSLNQSLDRHDFLSVSHGETIMIVRFTNQN